MPEHKTRARKSSYKRVDFLMHVFFLDVILVVLLSVALGTLILTGWGETTLYNLVLNLFLLLMIVFAGCAFWMTYEMVRPCHVDMTKENGETE